MTRKLKIFGGVVIVVVTSVAMTSSASADFTSAKYPYTASATSGNAVFDAFGSTIQCTENSFTLEKLGGGSIFEARSTLTLRPSYKKCTAFGLPATVNMTTCDFRVSSLSTPSNLSMAVECTTIGDGIDITIFSGITHLTPLCHVRLREQSGLLGGTATNIGSQLVISGSFSFLTATQVRNSIFCPAGEHTSTASYTVSEGGMIFTGTNGAISVD